MDDAFPCYLHLGQTTPSAPPFYALLPQQSHIRIIFFLMSIKHRNPLAIKAWPFCSSSNSMLELHWYPGLYLGREKSHTSPARVWLAVEMVPFFRMLPKHISHKRALILPRQLGSGVITLNWSRRGCWTYFSDALEISTNSNEKSFNEVHSISGRKQRQPVFPILFTDYEKSSQCCPPNCSILYAYKIQ